MRLSFLPHIGIAFASRLPLFAAAALAAGVVHAADFGLPAGYRLSLPVMEKCAAGRARVYERAQVDKRLKAELKREAAEDDDQEVQNIDQLVRGLEKNPLSAAVMKEAGCPVRDFALLIAGMTSAAGGQGAPENVEFIKRNGAKIRELDDKVEAAREKFEEAD